MISRDRAGLIGGTLIALSLLGFFFIPGHTFLQSDTQIYVPIFEQIENPQLYSRDFMLSTAHVGLTVYDETAIGLRRLTHSSFESVLMAEQIVFRALGLWGVFLIATGLGLGDSTGLLLAACYGLGATIVGPAVLSVEYEPVPRGFAVAFLMLATGLLVHQRYMSAGAAASIGFLYHSPSTLPFWILFAVVTVRQRQWRAWLPLGLASVVLALAYTAQQSHLRHQPFWTFIDPQWEQVIRMRTAYDWIGQWPAGSVVAFVLYGSVALVALWRIRERTNTGQRIVLGGFPVLGVLSIFVSWVLLDLWKWALMAQVQPARASLFTIVFAQINCGLAGSAAAQKRRWSEAAGFFVPVLLPVVMPQVLDGTMAQCATVALLVGVVLFAWRFRWLAAPAVALAGCWAIPHVAHTINYPALHSTELDQLSEWARTQTPEQAMFVFPASGRNLEQGVFRVKSLRSLYTDWKAGGQANYFRDFALEWSNRWKELAKGANSMDDWRAHGVNYVIYSGAHHEQLGQPAFQNGRYRAYALADNRSAP